MPYGKARQHFLKVLAGNRLHLRFVTFMTVGLSILCFSKREPASTTNNKKLAFAGSKYGGWWFDESLVSSTPVVFSFGLGEDTSWDEAMLNRGATVYGFDPTPKSIRYIRNRKELYSNRFILTEKGLANITGTIEFTLPSNPQHVSARAGKHEGLGSSIKLAVDTLRNHMLTHGLSHIDILKMDIEGAEYEVLEQLVAEKYFPFTQLLVEFHQRFESVGEEMHARVLNLLLLNGFTITHSQNGQEISFSKVHTVSSMR